MPATSADTKRSYFKVSTAHGLRRSGWAMQIWAKSVWIVIFIVCFAFFLFLLYNLVNDYNQHPTKVSQSLQVVDTLPYPSVTVCNLNQLNGQMIDISTKEHLKMIARNSNGGNIARDEILIKEVAKIHKSNEKLGHLLEDMILYCSFDGNLCHIENMSDSREFKFSPNQRYGNCYTFNSKASKVSSQPGPIYGLTLILNVERENYLSGVSGSEGFRIVIHSPGSEPFAEIEGFTVAPGFQASVGIQPTEYIREDEPYGECDKKSEQLGYKPTSMSCAAQCHGSDCICIPTCNETIYDLHVSFADWPSENHQSTIKNMIKTRYDGKFEIEELASVKLYFKEFQKKVVRELPQLSLPILLSQIGGLSAFFIGFSLLTIFEFVEILIDACISPCSGDKTISDDRKHSGPMKRHEDEKEICDEVTIEDVNQ